MSDTVMIDRTASKRQYHSTSLGRGTFWGRNEMRDDLQELKDEIERLERMGTSPRANVPIALGLLGIAQGLKDIAEAMNKKAKIEANWLKEDCRRP
jgi:hypothetical protein